MVNMCVTNSLRTQTEKTIKTIIYNLTSVEIRGPPPYILLGPMLAPVNCLYNIVHWLALGGRELTIQDFTVVITKRYGQGSRNNKASSKTAKTAVSWLFSISQTYDPAFDIHPLLQCSMVYLADKEIYRRCSWSKKTAKKRTRMTATSKWDSRTKLGKRLVK